ncbi:MAG: ubiquitin-conjugating enzyme/RWD-like protein [Piptocephalis tieghemiana]|nr:MAG: ubiquitin-conjugating enzyme/RWD-like protein [Piptocephalis tieghemiana]
MTDYAEEQSTELEVLQSIYPDEFEGKEGEPVEAYLTITYTPTYPDELPTFDIEDVEGSAGLESKERSKAMKEVTSMAEENLGMAMIFSMASTLKEQMDEALQIRQEALEKEALAKEMKELELERARFKGTAVTREGFMEWRKAFAKELADKERQSLNGKKNEAKKGKPTGRQLFEKDANLAASDATFYEEGDVTVDISQFDREAARRAEEEREREEQENESVVEMLRKSGASGGKDE